MKNQRLPRVHIIEPHPDDALGSAAALCLNTKLCAVIHTISGDGGSRDKINLTERKECRRFIGDHHRYFLQDYSWQRRADRRTSYAAALAAYRMEYTDLQMKKLSGAIKQIAEQAVAEEAYLAVPLGIMHPFHMLVADAAFHAVKECGVSLEKLWIYVDHPYDLHSMGSALMRESVLSAEKKLGKKLVRYDAWQVDQMKAGEILRAIYKDKHHAEFDGAFGKTFCGFYFPGQAGPEREGLVQLKKLDVLMVSSQVWPFVKGGGMANVLYDLLTKLQNYVNDVRILVPWLGDPLNIGTLKERREFRYIFPDGARADCVLEARLYEGVMYYFLGIGGVLQSLDEPLPYALFAELVLDKVLPELDFAPDILHCHDWQSGMLPFLIKAKYGRHALYRNMKTLYTIHFYGYQGVCRREALCSALRLPDDKKTERMLKKTGYLTGDAKRMAGVRDTQFISFMNAGIYFADCVSTVSEGYAKELAGYPAFKRGPGVCGIRNAISYERYDPLADYGYDRNHFPEKKAACKEAFQRKRGLAVERALPLVCVVSRLEHVKGIDSLLCALPELLKLPLQLVVMGDGKKSGYYRPFFDEFMAQWPGKFCYLPFEEDVETEIYAASDVVLVPSLSESCGTTQMLAMHYGAVPVVTALSSFKDTVTPPEKERMDKGVGYLTYPDDAWMLCEVMEKVLHDFRDRKKWDYMVWKCMVTDFSWEGGALKKYVALYHRMV